MACKYLIIQICDGALNQINPETERQAINLVSFMYVFLNEYSISLNETSKLTNTKARRQKVAFNTLKCSF